MLEQITFVGLKNIDRVTFNNKGLRVILINIFEPVLKLENCIWLNEECFEKSTNVGNTEGIREVRASNKENFEGKFKPKSEYFE